MFHAADPDLKLRFWWLLIGHGLVVLVLYLSLTSKPIEIDLDFSYQDKAYHAFAYFTLMMWFSQIYHGKSKRLMLAVVFVIMGISIEVLQSLNPARFAEYGDMVANTIGVVIGFYLGSTQLKNMLYKVEKIIG